MTADDSIHAQVLASGRHVARQIRRAGLENAHVVLGGEGFALLVVAEDLDLDAQRLPVARIGAALKVAGRHERLRHLDELVGVEIEVREDRVEAVRALVLVVVLQERIGGAGHPGDVARVDEALRARAPRRSARAVPSPSAAALPSRPSSIAFSSSVSLMFTPCASFCVGHSWDRLRREVTKVAEK